MHASHPFPLRKLTLEEQRQLLRAALVPGSEARTQALEWLARVDIDNIQFQSLRLMPQLYERLRTEGVDHPLLPRLKGLKKHAWSKNQMLFHSTAKAIRILREAGIETMTIKGMALILAYYRDFGLRPMGDADLLVPHAQAQAAGAALTAHGWTNEFDDPLFPGLFPIAIRYEHAGHFHDAMRRDLDLHWNLLHWRLGAGVDDDFWAASSTIDFAGETVRILHPADQLLHICVHAVDVEPICWIPDAVAVLRATPQMDWDRLVEQARQRKLSLMTAKALRLASLDFADLIPADVLRRLEKPPLARFERTELWVLEKDLQPLLGMRLRTPSNFMRLAYGKSLTTQLRALPEVVRYLWRVPQTRHLPASFLRRLLGKLGILPPYIQGPA